MAGVLNISPFKENTFNLNYSYFSSGFSLNQSSAFIIHKQKFGINIGKFKSNQFDLSVEDNNFKLIISKYGIIDIKNSSLDQALEIVRRRIDEVGTNEPNILRRGNDRILVELPGLDDPMRIKTLLGKTANLTFRFVTLNTESNSSDISLSIFSSSLF